jgi:hypothetical protein
MPAIPLLQLQMLRAPNFSVNRCGCQAMKIETSRHRRRNRGTIDVSGRTTRASCIGLPRLRWGAHSGGEWTGVGSSKPRQNSIKLTRTRSPLPGGRRHVTMGTCVDAVEACGRAAARGRL